jgi:hypothetical protein
VLGEIEFRKKFTPYDDQNSLERLKLHSNVWNPYAFKP